MPYGSERNSPLAGRNQALRAGHIRWQASGRRRSLLGAAEPEVTFDVVPRDRWTGEPYELAGRRMVFTSWYYVRPGGYAWVDAQGRGVTASGAKLGP